MVQEQLGSFTKKTLDTGWGISQYTRHAVRVGSGTNMNDTSTDINGTPAGLARSAEPPSNGCDGGRSLDRGVQALDQPRLSAKASVAALISSAGFRSAAQNWRHGMTAIGWPADPLLGISRVERIRRMK